MDREIEILQNYFYNTLHIRLEAKPWKGQARLPFFLVDLYNFYETSLLEQTCLFMIAKYRSEGFFSNRPVIRLKNLILQTISQIKIKIL